MVRMDHANRMLRLMAQFDKIHRPGWAKRNAKKLYEHIDIYGYRDPCSLMSDISDRNLQSLQAIDTADPLAGDTAVYITAKDIEKKSGVPARAVGRALASVGIYSHRKYYQRRVQRVFYAEDVQQILVNICNNNNE